MYLNLNIGTTSKKPNTLHNKDSYCPFCDRNTLNTEGNILKEKDNMVIIRNKFPTLQETYQTVFIEHHKCDYQMHNYSAEHLYKLFSFFFEQWIEMENSGKYKSVMAFKNFGPQSSGSIKHAHSQLVGLYDIDYRESLLDSYFEGEVIIKNDNIEYNISTSPKAENYEFNIIINDLKDLNLMADMIQNTTHYIINYLNPVMQSYNIFYYQYNGKYIAKVSNRFVTTAYLVGYNIKFVPSNIIEVKEDILNKYYKK